MCKPLRLLPDTDQLRIGAEGPTKEKVRGRLSTAGRCDSRMDVGKIVYKIEFCDRRIFNFVHRFFPAKHRNK